MAKNIITLFFLVNVIYCYSQKLNRNILSIPDTLMSLPVNTSYEDILKMITQDTVTYSMIYEDLFDDINNHTNSVFIDKGVDTSFIFSSDLNVVFDRDENVVMVAKIDECKNYGKYKTQRKKAFRRKVKFLSQFKELKREKFVYKEEKGAHIYPRKGFRYYEDDKLVFKLDMIKYGAFIFEIYFYPSLILR